MTSAYITPEGRSGLEAELSSLWERRARTVTALAAAAAEGDRSENAEYIYRRKELREIDRRVGYLQRRLPALRVVDQVRSHDRVYFGAWVTLEDESGASRTWRPGRVRSRSVLHQRGCAAGAGNDGQRGRRGICAERAGTHDALQDFRDPVPVTRGVAA